MLWASKSFFSITAHHNKGAFLNAGQKRQAAVAAVSVLLTIGVAAVFALSLGMQGNRMLKAGLSMLLGGAFSNTYDRLKRKYVVDYFSFHVHLLSGCMSARQRFCFRIFF